MHLIRFYVSTPLDDSTPFYIYRILSNLFLFRNNYKLRETKNPQYGTVKEFHCQFAPKARIGYNCPAKKKVIKWKLTGAIQVKDGEAHDDHKQVGKRSYSSSTRESDEKLQKMITLKVPSRLIRNEMIKEGHFGNEVATTFNGRKAANQKIMR